MCKKASQRIAVLMQLGKLIPTKAKLQSYKVAVLLYITYCHLVSPFCRASDSRKFVRLEETGMKAVYNAKRAANFDEETSARH